MKDTPKSTRLVIAIIAILVGLFLIFAVPFIVQTSLERVLTKLQAAMVERPELESGIALFSLFYPFWRALAFVAGITLLSISLSIYKGKEWTYPLALAAFAIPSVGGMFMFLPYISFVGGFPLPMVVSWAGLLGYWSTLLLRRSDRMQKVVNFLVFTFIGMLTTHAFVIGIAAQRMLITRPGKPLFDGIQWWVLTLSGEVNWIGVLMLLISIPLLAMRKRSGWWLAFIAALSILLIDAPTQILRTRTLDYLYGSLLSIALIVFLSIPAFKKRLIADEIGS